MDSLGVSQNDDPNSTPVSDDHADLSARWQQALADAHDTPDEHDVQLAQLAIPGAPPLPIPPDALPASPTPQQWGAALDRAGRRLDYAGSEIAHGHVGSAAGHLILGNPYPPGVDDPGPEAGTVTEMAATPVPAAALPAAAVDAMAQAKSKGCNLSFVEEHSDYAKGTPWRAYEDQTPGAITDPATGNRIVPALQYANPKPNGLPQVRFDGFQPLPDGQTEVIDSKLSVTSWPKNGQTFVPDRPAGQLKRQSEALEQNPGCSGMIHVPDEEKQARAKDTMEELSITNLPVEVRPFVQ